MRVEERDEPRADAAGRTRAGHVAHAPTDELLDHVRVTRERAVELAHHRWRGALLRTEHRARALGTEKRVAHVAGDVDRGTHETRIGLPVDTRELRERGTAFGKLATRTVEEVIAERARHARTAVVRRASADPDHDAMRTGRG